MSGEGLVCGSVAVGPSREARGGPAAPRRPAAKLRPPRGPGPENHDGRTKPSAEPGLPGGRTPSWGACVIVPKAGLLPAFGKLTWWPVGARGMAVIVTATPPVPNTESRASKTTACHQTHACACARLDTDISRSVYCRRCSDAANSRHADLPVFVHVDALTGTREIDAAIL